MHVNQAISKNARDLILGQMDSVFSLRVRVIQNNYFEGCRDDQRGHDTCNIQNEFMTKPFVGDD